MFKKYLLLFIPLCLFTALFPQFSRAAADHMVISQIQIAGTTATDEFVELFNPTGSSIDLTGYRLTKKISSGTQSTLVASMSGSIAPNTYFLIKYPTGFESETSAFATNPSENSSISTKKLKCG